MARINFDEAVLVSEEANKEQKEFTFWNIVAGIFGDLKEFSNELNAVVDAAYLEV